MIVKIKNYITFPLGLNILGTISISFAKSWALCQPFISFLRFWQRWP